MESPIASPKALCSPRGPGSPRPLLKPHETVPELGGKAWHVGDPHSRYRFIRCAPAAAAAAAPVAFGRRRCLRPTCISPCACAEPRDGARKQGAGQGQHAGRARCKLAAAGAPPCRRSTPDASARMHPLRRRVLGTGHYGVTYLCSSLLTGELVAIKALDKLHPEYQREAAIEEIRILAAVSARGAAPPPLPAVLLCAGMHGHRGARR